MFDAGGPKRGYRPLPPFTAASMKSNFDDVELFHQKFGILPEDPLPHLLDESTFNFRYKFMVEELTEFLDANTDGDLARAFDALIDLVYVAMGTAVLMSLPWEKGWDAVQAANMKKVRAASAADSAAKTGRGHSIDVVKPEGWTPPDIQALLESHLGLLRRALNIREIRGVLDNERNLPKVSTEELVRARLLVNTFKSMRAVVGGHPDIGRAFGILGIGEKEIYDAMVLTGEVKQSEDHS